MTDPLSSHLDKPTGASSPAPVKGSPGTPHRLRRRMLWAAVAALVIAIVVTAAGGIDLLAQNFFSRFTGTTLPIEAETKVSLTTPAPAGNTFTLLGLDIHPDFLYQPYLSGSLLSTEAAHAARSISDFRALLDLYTQRQKVDDNFTLRVTDNRTGDLLEIYTLTAEREKYNKEKHADWDAIDLLRRTETRRLVDKHVKRGRPREAVTVKWGRANQVQEAHERNADYIEYELRLARYLDLSLLITQIGTVETFNLDDRVSPVGARSRYQMMPYILRERGIHHYQLKTASGKPLQVFEEWHPLLTMEPAFLVLRGYANAVGHEISGISAYHTGPANIFKLYRLFLTESKGLFNPSSSVLDAYVWGVTEGFDVVSQQTTFKNQSRGYVASAYGALKATDEQPIDTTQTLRAERVQVKAGRQVFLSQLLQKLDVQGDKLYWGHGTDSMSTYNRFRHVNPHIVLPYSDDSLGVPVAGDVRFVHEAGDADVRFFLPLGASRLLAQAGLNVLDDHVLFRYDHEVYGASKQEETTWDREYDALVRDIARFGFTNDNRKTLLELADRFKELAETHPSPYRRAQLQIIKTHKTIWLTRAWEQLASAATAAKGEIRVPVLPPSTLEPALKPPAISSR